MAEFPLMITYSVVTNFFVSPVCSKKAQPVNTIMLIGKFGTFMQSKFVMLYENGGIVFSP